MNNKHKFETSSETTYSISRLTFEDVELICQGLDKAGEDLEFDLLDRKNALVEAFESMLPDIQSME